MKPMNGLSVWIGAAALAFASAACNNTADGMKKDAEENKREAAQSAAEARQKADEASDSAARAADRAKDAADRAGDRAEGAANRAGDKADDAANRVGTSMSRAGEKTRDAARDAGDKTADAGRNTGNAVGSAAETVEVKTALMADKRVDASGINVDTDAATKTVILKGHVPTAAQKTIAGDIARKKAEGYKVRNELSVGN